MYERIGNSTICRDTPENWRHFERMKAALIASKGKRSILDGQIDRENKALRQLSQFPPGYEPDR